MIVEFIGCSGSGKTTLIHDVQIRLAKTTRVVTAHELVAGRVGLGGVTNPTGQNLIQELISLPYFVGSLGRHRAFLAFTIRALTRGSHLSFATIHNLRSLERKIGVYEMARRYERDSVVLIDEGPIQAMHMFAFTAAPVGGRDIARFAALLPVTDLVVYVNSPIETLVRRTMRRPDPPREMRSKNEIVTEGYVRKATALFDRLVQSGNISDRVLTVTHSFHAGQEYDNLVEEITSAIVGYGKDVAAPNPIGRVSAAI